MRKKGAVLYGPMKQTQRLLKQDFQITQQSLQQGVENEISRVVQELGFLETPLDPKQVDWDRIILSAVRREPPFENSDKEKGFRDAVVC